jgi:transcriptional regulator with XRE-family HTH domain
MDVAKIGRFIQEKRKAKNLTQSELARLLFITDRAVSKWECGRSLPDSSIMLELCKVLGISVNELLLGEEIPMEKSSNQTEEVLIQIMKDKEASDKSLLQLEIVLGVVGTLFLLAMLFIGMLGYQYLNLPLWAMLLMFGVGFVIFIVAILFCVRIEQKAGYYECKECHQKFIA